MHEYASLEKIDYLTSVLIDIDDDNDNLCKHSSSIKCSCMLEKDMLYSNWKDFHFMHLQSLNTVLI